jgi:mono/diheme cytochrome c family protein
LDTLSQLGIFKTALSHPVHELPKLPDPNNESQSLESRVRAYLHVNCAVCHELEDGNRSGGGGNSNFDVSFWKDSDAMLIVNADPKHGRFGIPAAKLVVPGDPDRSILYLRMSRRGQGQMPPLASSMIDPSAVEMVEEWIEHMEAPTQQAPPEVRRN